MRLVAEMKKVWESKARAEKKILMADEILGSIILVKATEKRLTITAAPRSDEKQTRQKERKKKENGKGQKKTKTRGTKESNEKSVTRVCSVLGVGNGRERITVEPFLQIMTPARKGTDAPMHKHPEPTSDKNKLVQAEYWENGVFLATTKWWLGGNWLLSIKSNPPHVANFRWKKDADNRAP